MVTRLSLFTVIPLHLCGTDCVFICFGLLFQTVGDCVEHYYMTKPFYFDFHEVSKNLIVSPRICFSYKDLTGLLSLKCDWHQSQ